MINTVIDGISLAINAEFGDTYKIHTESVEQGLTAPCFVIFCINPKISKLIGVNHYRRTNSFVVHYFPSSDEKRRECMDVLDRLYNCLELISPTVEDKYMGIDMKGQMNDSDVLDFFVNYDFNSLNIDENSETGITGVDLMGNLVVETIDVE